MANKAKERIRNYQQDGEERSKAVAENKEAVKRVASDVATGQRGECPTRTAD